MAPGWISMWDRFNGLAISFFICKPTLGYSDPSGRPTFSSNILIWGLRVVLSLLRRAISSLRLLTVCNMGFIRPNVQLTFKGSYKLDAKCLEFVAVENWRQKYCPIK
jgi:hypothetical protein